MEAKEYYTWLLTQYYYGQASEEEQAELFAELSKNQHTQEWVEMIKELHLAAGADAAYDAARWQSAADRILATPQLQEEPMVRRMKPRRWMAAAAAVLVIATGIVIWTNRSRDTVKDQLAKTDSTIVLPGKNKAQLKLADGRVIDLDDAKKGAIATENGALISKSADGQLEYNAEGKATTAALHTLSTPRGGQYQLTLPDGSRVWLNAASSITYPSVFNGAYRNIAIAGEAYFEVVHKVSQPFRVAINNRDTVEVLGTDFNINAYSDEPEIRTTLLKGSIRMNNNGIRQLLEPGQQAGIDTKGRMRIDPAADLESAIAWKNGQFPMKNIDLASFMRQVSRWYDVEVKFNGTPSRQLFGGLMRRDVQLSTLMKVLKEYGIETTLNNKILTVE